MSGAWVCHLDFWLSPFGLPPVVFLRDASWLSFDHQSTSLSNFASSSARPVSPACDPTVTYEITVFFKPPLMRFLAPSAPPDLCVHFSVPRVTSLGLNRSRSVAAVLSSSPFHPALTLCSAMILCRCLRKALLGFHALQGLPDSTEVSSSQTSPFLLDLVFVALFVQGGFRPTTSMIFKDLSDRFDRRHDFRFPVHQGSHTLLGLSIPTSHPPRVDCSTGVRPYGPSRFPISNEHQPSSGKLRSAWERGKGEERRFRRGVGKRRPRGSLRRTFVSLPTEGPGRFNAGGGRDIEFPCWRVKIGKGVDSIGGE